LEPDIRKWLPEGHLAHFINNTVDNLDLSEIFEYYERSDRGYPPYHPKMMIKVLMYGYCIGLTASRRIAKALQEDVAFRVLGAGNFPDFRTISDFRKIHLKRLMKLFVQVIEMCEEAGLVKLGVVAIDGTKIKANASMEKNRNYKNLCKEEKRRRKELEKMVEEDLKKAIELDEEEDRIYGKDKRGDEMPPGFRTNKEQLERIKEAQERIKKKHKKKRLDYETMMIRRTRKEKKTGMRTRGWVPKEVPEEPDEKMMANMTDPDSSLRRTRHGFIQGYNAQITVDADSQVILANDVVTDQNDLHQLVPMIKRTILNTGRMPKATTTDAGYWSPKGADEAGKLTDLYITTNKDWKERRLLLKQSPPRGRLPKNISLKDRMERKLRSKKGREIYKMRGKSVEPAIGQIKAVRGFKQFMLRSLEKVKGEWSLITMAHNILKLWRNRRPRPIP
jgi:transposase